jgi:hypothetical protein
MSAGAQNGGYGDDDAFADVPVVCSRDDDDDLMALGLDASELQEFFGDS